ncbi:MAG: DUF3089 domain-containing protein [Solirubrobacteraceae bacterium]
MTRIGRRRALLAITAAVGTGALGGVAVPQASATTWLCRPGLAHNPCTPGLSTTRFSPAGARLGVQRVTAVRRPKIDCFYVYPTVSDQKTVQANLHVDPVQRSIALYQAARYSQLCRIYAPMYRQLTLKAISGKVPAAAAASAFADVRSAWRDYLARYNHGRGVVLIGHSQGAGMLTQLVRTEIDRKPAVRRRLVSALLLGGNVVVPAGRDVGGSFAHVPACRSRTQLGCVVAFSTYDETPPANSLFGRVSARFGSLFHLPTGRRYRVLCTNPAALRGGSAPIDPIFPSAPFAPGSSIAAGIALLKIKLPTARTTWVSVPGSYSARCTTSNGASVLMITPRRGAPKPTASPDPTWGLHLMDANVALGNLVDLVRSEAAAYARGSAGR